MKSRIFVNQKPDNMNDCCLIYNEYNELIGHAELLRDGSKIDEAVLVCSAAVEWAVDKGILKKEMQARNLLASLYRLNHDYNEMLVQYDKVISIAREHNLRYTDECTHALVRMVLFLSSVQPTPSLSLLFSLADELVEVRGKMVNDENDKELQDYKMIRDTLKRTYKRRHRLRTLSER